MEADSHLTAGMHRSINVPGYQCWLFLLQGNVKASDRLPIVDNSGNLKIRNSNIETRNNIKIQIPRVSS